MVGLSVYIVSVEVECHQPLVSLLAQVTMKDGGQLPMVIVFGSYRECG